MSCNKWWSIKVGAQLLSDLLILSIFSSEIPLDFRESIRVVLLKYLMYFLADISTKLSKFVYMSAISFLVAQFASLILQKNFLCEPIKFLISIISMVLISIIFVFTFTNILYYSYFFFTKLLMLGILFSTAVREVVAAKLVTLGFLFLTSFILALRAFAEAKLVNTRYFTFNFIYFSIKSS